VENGEAIDLGVLPGDEDSSAAAINEGGVIVGSTGRTDQLNYENFYRPFIYENGFMTAIPAPSSEAYALDINDHGVVVGAMRGAAGFHAFIYTNGAVADLNSLIPSGSGLHLSFAYGINNAGQTVGLAYDAQMRQHAFLLTPVGEGTPVLSISDASVTEGNTGTRSANLTVALSAASSQQVMINYGTTDGTATGGVDYVSVAGTVTFAAGETSKTISVVINGDRNPELNETVIVRLSNTSDSAIIGDGHATITIVDDEPRMRISSVVKPEGCLRCWKAVKNGSSDECSRASAQCPSTKRKR
jgi:probable HAF family extracellular repeat protein